MNVEYYFTPRPSVTPLLRLTGIAAQRQSEQDALGKAAWDRYFAAMTALANLAMIEPDAVNADWCLSAFPICAEATAVYGLIRGETLAPRWRSDVDFPTLKNIRGNVWPVAPYPSIFGANEAVRCAIGRYAKALIDAGIGIVGTSDTETFWKRAKEIGA